MAGSAGCGHITIATTILSLSVFLPLCYVCSRSLTLFVCPAFTSRFIAAAECLVSLLPSEIHGRYRADNNSEALSPFLSVFRSFYTLRSESVPLSARSRCARGSRDTPVRVRRRELPSRRIVGLLQWPALLNVSLSSAFSLPMRRCARTIVSRQMGGSPPRQPDHRHREIGRAHV